MPAGATYEPIATTTLGSANNAFTFSSIPSTYTDLRIVIRGSAASGDVIPAIRFNGDTGTNYSDTFIRGNGTAASSGRNTSRDFIGATTGASIQVAYANIGMLIIDVFSYAGSTNKTALIQVAFDQNGYGDAGRIVGLWRSTSAINSVTIYSRLQDWATGSMATLYGIKAA